SLTYRRASAIFARRFLLNNSVSISRLPLCEVIVLTEMPMSTTKSNKSAKTRMISWFPSCSWRPSWFIATLLIAVCLTTASGCTGGGSSSSGPDASWGRHGISDGRFSKPRAIAVDASDHLYVVDMTARIQVFDADGNYLRQWQTPDHKNGCPTGLNFDREGN